MRHWKNDKELFTLMKTYLYTAVVGDIMDGTAEPVSASAD